MSVLHATGPFDTLLGWASEFGAGTWTHWREACVELGVEPTTAMQDLAALGHTEMDWSANRFACPPPTAAYLHRSSGCVLLTGARPQGLLARLAELEDDLDFYVHEARPQPRGPETVLIEVDLDDAPAFCAAAGLQWVFDPAGRIADSLPAASLDALASHEDWPPRDDTPRRRFDPATISFRAERASDSERGLWHYDGHRRADAWYYDGEHWWKVPTREYAPYLAHPDITFLTYRDTQHQLFVPTAVPLPPLQARAAALASGRLPRKTASGPSALAIATGAGASSVDRVPTWIYENVSAELAHRIAGSLSTDLGEER